jgi:hypothetical protein
MRLDPNYLRRYQIDQIDHFTARLFGFSKAAGQARPRQMSAEG